MASTTTLLPAWSPHGKEIAFVTKRGVDSGRTENWDVYLIEAKAGAKERQLTTTPEADAHPDWESAPAWSPDGKTIAFIHGGDPKKIEYATHSLSIIPAAGGEAKILTADLDRNVVEPHWAPDGKSIFVVLEDDGAETLVRVAGGLRGRRRCPRRPANPVVGGPPQNHGLRREQRRPRHRAREHARPALLKFSRPRTTSCVT